VKLFFDGGCRPNPGRIETAVVTAGRSHVVRDAGFGDNSDAEWLALIAAATIARDSGARDVTFLGDSAAIVAQASGVARCRRGHLAVYEDIVAGIPRVHVRRIPRSRNLAGIALAAAHPR
jgi:ribonuclease HI